MRLNWTQDDTNKLLTLKDTVECDEIRRKYPQPQFLQSCPQFIKAAKLYGRLRDSVHKIASEINAEAPKDLSAPITYVIWPDCWTQYIH